MHIYFKIFVYLSLIMSSRNTFRPMRVTQSQRETQEKIKKIIQHYIYIEGEPKIANKTYVAPAFAQYLFHLASSVIEPNKPKKISIVGDDNMKDVRQMINFANELVAEMNRDNQYNIIDYTIKKRTELLDSPLLYLIIHNKQDRATIRNRRKQQHDPESDADTDDETLTTPALLSTVRQLHSRLLALEQASVNIPTPEFVNID